MCGNSFSQELDLNNILLNCIYEEYENEGVDLQVLLVEYEEYLIKTQLLDDKTAKGYISLLQFIVKDNDNFMEIPESVFQSISKVNPNKLNLYDCLFSKLDVIDTQKIINTKPIILEKKIRRTDNNSLSKTAQIILNVLSEEDIENKYFKTLLLLAFAWTSYTI